MSLLLAGLALSGCGTAASSAAPQHAAPTATAPTATAPVAPVEPVSLRIPAIAVNATVAGLGLNPDDTVEVPTNPAHTGWYRLGPTPGEAGSAVILGHVDSKTGPAVFARLKNLRAGNKIEVTMSDHSVVRYAVTTVRTHPIAKFPAKRVYGGTGAATLNLVTCGGEYDPVIGYLSNVVAYTSLVPAA